MNQQNTNQFSFRGKDIRVSSIEEAVELLKKTNPWTNAMCKMMHMVVDFLGEMEASEILIKQMSGRRLPKSVHMRFCKSGDVDRIRFERMSPKMRRRIVRERGARRPEGMRDVGKFNPNVVVPASPNEGVKTNVPGRGPAKGPGGSKSTQYSNPEKAAKRARKQGQKK